MRNRRTEWPCTEAEETGTVSRRDRHGKQKIQEAREAEETGTGSRRDYHGKQERPEHGKQKRQ
jgi:hypothetical protein